METTERKHIAETIRRARLLKGWQVQEAARLVGVTPSNWSRWETATSTPRPATMVKIGELLDLPADWATATPSQPSRTVDPDELLERIRAELAEHERRIEQMLARMTGADNARPDDSGRNIERDGRRDVADARSDDGARHDQDSR